jgi:hypothetical protein
MKNGREVQESIQVERRGEEKQGLLESLYEVLCWYHLPVNAEVMGDHV